MDGKDPLPDPSSSSKSDFVATPEFLEMFWQCFKSELSRAVATRASLPRFALDSGVERLEPPWRRSPGADVDTSYWKPPSYLVGKPSGAVRSYWNPPPHFFDPSSVAATATAEDYKDSHVDLERPRTPASENSLDSSDDQRTRCSGSSIDSQGLSRESRGNHTRGLALMNSRRENVSVPPLTASQLREKLLQVADPALKYCKLRESYNSRRSSRTDVCNSTRPFQECVKDNCTPSRNTSIRGGKGGGCDLSCPPPSRTLLPQSTRGKSVQTVSNTHGGVLHGGLWGRRGFESCQSWRFCPEKSSQRQFDTSTRFWWDVPANETILRRAIQGRTEAREENLIPGLEPTSSVANSQHPRHGEETEYVSRQSGCSLIASPSKERQPSEMLNYDAAQMQTRLSKLTRKLRTEILLLVIGVREQCSTSFGSSTPRDGRNSDNRMGKSGDGSFCDFLKLTPAEKKAFYCSMGMNRISAGLGVDGLSLEEANFVSSIDTATWTVATCPEILESWCMAEKAGLEHRVDNVRIVLWNSNVIRMGAADLSCNNDVQRLGRNITSIEKLTGEIERVCNAWTFALRKLPHLVNKVHVHGVVPPWLDRQQLDMSLAQMKSYALFNTGGQVTWVQYLENDQAFACNDCGQGYPMDAENCRRAAVYCDVTSADY